MAVKIGHSSIDERGKISGGVAGDQTGYEVCQRDFYMHSKGWVVLRAKDPTIAENIAKCMEDACANPYIGYDQSQRLSLYDTVKNLKFRCDINTLKVYVESDCSSLVRVCLAYAGVHVGNFTTANEKSVILATGKFEEVVCAADGSNLKRGDILVTKTKGHTVIVLTNGAKAVKKPDVIYQVYADGKWWGEITNYNNVNSNGYAGVYGKEISGIRVRLSNGETVTVQSHVSGKAKNDWLSPITKWDNTSNGYSGWKGKPTDCIAMKANGCTLRYRVHTKGGKWLGWITKLDLNDAINGLAGNYGQPIDAVQIEVV